MNIQEIEIKDLKPYALNAKRHPQMQIEGIAESIRRFGFTQPIVVDKNNEVIIGHGRLAAAQLTGLNKVPCLKLEKLREQEVRALRLIDNRISETGWDESLLIEDLTTMDFNFADFKLDFDFLYPKDLDVDDFFSESESVKKEDFTINLIFKNEEERDEAKERLIGEGYRIK